MKPWERDARDYLDRAFSDYLDRDDRPDPDPADKDRDPVLECAQFVRWAGGFFGVGLFGVYAAAEAEAHDRSDDRNPEKKRKPDDLDGYGHY